MYGSRAPNGIVRSVEDQQANFLLWQCMRDVNNLKEGGSFSFHHGMKGRWEQRARLLPARKYTDSVR